MTLMTTYPHLGLELTWETSIDKKISRMFANALCADYSQSNIYRGNVLSIPYIFVTNMNNPQNLISILKEKILNYYLNSFSVVSVDVGYNYSTTNPDQFIVNIAINVTDSNGVNHNLSQLLPGNLKPVSDVITEFN